MNNSQWFLVSIDSSIPFYILPKSRHTCFIRFFLAPVQLVIRGCLPRSHFKPIECSAGQAADCLPCEVSVWQHRDDTSIYVDCQEQTIREDHTGKNWAILTSTNHCFRLQDQDHQGLFRLCKYFGGLPPLGCSISLEEAQVFSSKYIQSAFHSVSFDPGDTNPALVSCRNCGLRAASQMNFQPFSIISMFWVPSTLCLIFGCAWSTHWLPIRLDQQTGTKRFKVRTCRQLCWIYEFLSDVWTCFAMELTWVNNYHSMILEPWLIFAILYPLHISELMAVDVVLLLSWRRHPIVCSRCSPISACRGSQVSRGGHHNMGPAKTLGPPLPSRAFCNGWLKFFCAIRFLLILSFNHGSPQFFSNVFGSVTGSYDRLSRYLDRTRFPQDAIVCKAS